MRILNVTQCYAPFLEFGGPPIKVRALAEGLSRRGHQVTVLTADWGLESRIGAEGAEAVGAERSPFGWRLKVHGVQAIYLPTWFRYRALSWNPAVNRYCRARLQNFDVVHIFGLYDFLGPAVAELCRRRNLPYVLEPIGMFVPIVRNLRLKQIYHSLFGRRLLAGARAVIATSGQEASELADGGVPREKIIIRRNGVEAPAKWPEPGGFRKAHGIPPDAKVVLFLGRLSAKKSPDLLLQAFCSLPERLGEKQLLLIYAGPDEAGMKTGLERLAAKLEAGSRVRFAGPLFGEAKWAAYRDADVFVLPSQNENFGNTAAEAAAAGTPVIVTDRCGIAPLFAHRGGLVVTHEAGALTAAMGKILGDAQLHARLAAGCVEATARLGWEEPVRAMETLYTTLALPHALGAESHCVD
jgi:glycosyltransferase involved in cell wall biosynthesis